MSHIKKYYQATRIKNNWVRDLNEEKRIAESHPGYTFQSSEVSIDHRSGKVCVWLDKPGLTNEQLKRRKS